MVHILRESSCESGEGVRLPKERGWPPGKSGNFWGSLGNFRGSSGNFRGTPGLLLSSTVRELPGKSLKNFRGSLGNFRGSRGTSQKLGGAWLPTSDSPICLQHTLSNYHLSHFPICACHPCAGAMLIFSVSFQFYRSTLFLVVRGKGPTGPQIPTKNQSNERVTKKRLESSEKRTKKRNNKIVTKHLSREKFYTPPPPPPHFWLKGIFQGRGVGVYILRPHAAGILYAPPFYTPPTPRRVFQGWGGGGV